MESRQHVARIEKLEEELGSVRAEHERLIDIIGEYYGRAARSECIPMEGDAVVSLSVIDEWCYEYTDHHLVEASDYLDAVGIQSSSSDPYHVSFADASILARKLWAYVSSFMNGGHDYLFDSAKVYLQRALRERLRSEQWIEQRQQALEQLLKLESQFIAMANINASLPANDADLYLCVAEEMLLDANSKTAYDVEYRIDVIQEIEFLITILEGVINRAACAINAFNQGMLSAAMAGNSLIGTEFVDFSVLQDLGISAELPSE